jgi:HD-GYP domain-containing protein (c-di-GMP phosphodiesterase class II)
MEAVVGKLQAAADEIGRANSRISDDTAVCRRRRQSYLADVSRLLATCARENRRIAASVLELEATNEEIAAGVRERLPDRTVRGPVAEQARPAKQERPGEEEAREHVVEAVLEEIDDGEVDSIYREMQQFVETFLASVAGDGIADLRPARDLIGSVIGKDGALDALYRKAIYSGAAPEEWDLTSAVVVHSANVAVYALMLGKGLGYDIPRLQGLGLAALVHDVGMVSLPPEIFAKEHLDETDRSGLRQHPLKGRDYLLRLGEEDRWLAEVVAQEHEREDGSGYPNSLRGKEIREQAKIIGLVDTYAGLTRSRPNRRGLPPFEAVKQITQTDRAKFHPTILRAMLHELSAFPVGSLVRLNSGTVGQVVETLEAYPLRPLIRPLYDAAQRPIEGNRTLALRDNPILHISGVVYPEDLQPPEA